MKTAWLCARTRRGFFFENLLICQRFLLRSARAAGFGTMRFPAGGRDFIGPIPPSLMIRYAGRGLSYLILWFLSIGNSERNRKNRMGMSAQKKEGPEITPSKPAISGAFVLIHAFSSRGGKSRGRLNRKSYLISLVQCGQRVALMSISLRQ